MEMPGRKMQKLHESAYEINLLSLQYSKWSGMESQSENGDAKYRTQKHFVEVQVAVVFGIMLGFIT